MFLCIYYYAYIKLLSLAAGSIILDFMKPIRLSLALMNNEQYIKTRLSKDSVPHLARVKRDGKFTCDAILYTVFFLAKNGSIS